ncbi:MAG: ABC transporter ATP-binding protein [Bacteroidota bacterium]
MRSLALLNKYLIRYRGRLFLGILFVVLQNFGAIYPAQVVRKSLDEVVDFLSTSGNGSDAGLANEISRQVFHFLLLIIAVALLRGLLMFLMRQTIIVMSRKVEFDLKNDLFRQYQRLNTSFYRRNNTGDLMNRISEDIGRVRMYIGPAIMYSINLLALFVIVTAIMYHVNSTLTLYVLAPLPFLSISIYLVSDVMNRRGEQVQEQQSRLSTFVQEAFSGIRVLKAFAKEDAFTQEFASESDDYLKKNMDLVRVNALFYPLMLLLVGCSTLLVVYIGGREVIAGRATAGNIAEFIIYVNMLTWPVASLGWVTSIIQRAAASQERINEFMLLEPEIVSVDNEPVQLIGHVQFRNVSFTYPESGICALKDVSFDLPSGTSLAVLGRTGSGKSTIAQLLLRMYDPDSGEILIDGRPLKELPLSSLRGQIGYVPQDVFLFSDTISNNISFGLSSETASEQDLKRTIADAAEAAVIADNIREFPDGFETMLGERGITLSGGQKQRVSIARALIRNPRILVFDDCLSAVDTRTEEAIHQELKKATGNRTALFISHRVSATKNTERIIFLENGSIVEEGTHLSLLKQKGPYYALYKRQLMEEKSNQAEEA